MSGAFWAGIYVTSEKSALLLVDMRVLSRSAAASGATLRSGLLFGDLTDSKDGLGLFLEHAVAVRVAASAAIAFFGLRGGYVDFDFDRLEASINVVRQNINRCE